MLLCRFILCDGQHEHAPWSITNGVFDTSLEAEYTPCFAKALATAILEAIAGDFKLPNVVQHAKRLKMSHFNAIAAAKQPSKSLQLATVPEFSHIVAISNLPCQFVFHVVDSVLAQCTCISWHNQTCSIPRQSKLLRTTRKKGGENRRFKLSQEHTPALQSLSDIASSPAAISDSFWKGCGKGEPSCSQISFSLDADEICGECCDWVFGIRWSPEGFLAQAVSVGHPFSVFSGLPLEVKNACMFLAENEDVSVINHRCSKLGEWLRMSRSLRTQEEALRNGGRFWRAKSCV